MSLVDTVAGRCLAVAVRRWPAELRDECETEWRAEMHAIATDPALRAVTRGVRRLRFAFSLATSPPVEDGGVPRGWREILPAWGRTLWPAVVLFGLGMACRFLAGSVFGLSMSVYDFATGGRLDGTATGVWARLGLNAAILGAAAVLLAWVGSRLARAVPLFREAHTPARRLLSTLLAVALAGAGLAFSGSGSVDPVADVYRDNPLPTLLWTVVTALVAAGAVRLARSGRVLLARVLAVGGGLVLLDLLSIAFGSRLAAMSVTVQAGPDTYAYSLTTHGLPAVPGTLDLWESPLWFPLSLGDPWVLGTDDLMRMGVANPAIPGALSMWTTAFLLLLAVSVAYALPGRAEERRAAAPVAVPADGTRTLGARPRIAAFACAGTAGLVWAAVLAASATWPEQPIAVSELFGWAFTLRQGALLLGLLATAFALNGRGRPMPFVFGGGVLLASADTALDAWDVRWPTAFGIAAAFAFAVGTAIVWCTRRFAAGATDPGSARRGRIMVAVMALFAAPLPLTATPMWSFHVGEAVPAGMPLGVAAVSALLAALGTGAALSARLRPLSRVAAVLLIGEPTVLLAAIGLYSGTPEGEAARWAGFLYLPMGLTALALIRWERPARRVLAAILWPAAIVASAPLAYPLTKVLFGAGSALTGVLSDGLGPVENQLNGPLASLVLAGALPLALIAARRFEPPGPRPASPSPEPAPRPLQAM